MNKHTPGPWQIEAADEFAPREGYWDVVALGNGCTTIAHAATHSNARLIAAAPELLAALRFCEEELSLLMSDKQRVRQALEMARVAIAKTE